MVSVRTVVVLCDVCKQKRPTKKVRVGYVGSTLRHLDLCENDRTEVDRLLAAASARPQRGLGNIPVVADPATIKADTPARGSETAPGATKRRSRGKSTPRTSRASQAASAEEGS